MGLERIITIGVNHPSLAGHFPSHPVVPGVVMLGEIMNDVRELVKANVEFEGMPSVKFTSPLNPGEPLTIRLEQQDEGATEFTCTIGARLIASGCLRYRLIAGGPDG